MLPACAAAAQVRDLLDHPEDYEIVSVSRDVSASAYASFSFDVGYWGGDHFSLICDVAVAPRWHPPDPSDYAELADRLRGFNADVLFETRAEAQAFLDYYRTKSWAETEFEPGEFCVIELGAG